MSEVRFRSISTSIKVRTQNLLKADDSQSWRHLETQ